MGILKILSLFFLLSCAKISYIADQGLGQLHIQWKARSNEEVLKDKSIPEDQKKKILLVGEYKAFFENYFGKKFPGIYEKTTFLNREAVSYMVTASLKNRIEPHYESFPFVGKFPYLAFFKREKAKNYTLKLEEKGYVTWIRPVHAYSSLNYFTDRILSSFFVFSPLELAELIFHELTHLLYFSKNGLAFNEALAQYVAHEMILKYIPQVGEKQGEDFLMKAQLRREFSRKMVPIVRELQGVYKRSPANADFEKIKNRFLKKNFIPLLLEFCEKRKESERKTCDTEPRNWNNARLVGFMNYEGLYEEVERLHRESGLNLKEFIFSIDRLRKTSSP